MRCSAIYLGLLSPTSSIDLPTGIRRAAHPAYLVFQPLRFTWHPMSPWNPVGSYPTISPITCESQMRNHRLVFFLLHLLFSDKSEPFQLGSKVPVAARTFLPLAQATDFSEDIFRRKIRGFFCKRKNAFRSGLICSLSNFYHNLAEAVLWRILWTLPGTEQNDLPHVSFIRHSLLLPGCFTSC